MPDYEILHDAGYNVLTYDLRNHGLSSAANAGVVTYGLPRAVTSPARSSTHARLGARQMAIGLFSRCMGAVSTFAAMTRFPAAFDGVRCLVSPQPVTPRYIAERRPAVIGVGDRLDDFNTLLRLRTSVGLDQGLSLRLHLGRRTRPCCDAMLSVHFVTMTFMSELPAGDTHDVIRRSGKVVAVVVPIEEYQQLRQAMQEQQVNEEFHAVRAGYLARREAGAIRYVSQEEAGRRLGMPSR